MIALRRSQARGCGRSQRHCRSREVPPPEPRSFTGRPWWRPEGFPRHRDQWRKPQRRLQLLSSTARSDVSGAGSENPIPGSRMSRSATTLRRKAETAPRRTAQLRRAPPVEGDRCGGVPSRCAECITTSLRRSAISG